MTVMGSEPYCDRPARAWLVIQTRLFLRAGWERQRLHWINLVFTLCGALTAGYFGGRALAEVYPEATTAAIVLGHVSSGVLGGFRSVRGNELSGRTAAS